MLRAAFAAEVRQSAEEAEEDVLGEVFERVVTAGEAREGAEDESLVFVDDLVEVEVGGQGRVDSLDLAPHSKFHYGE